MSDVPTIYFPRKGDVAPEPVPFVMTERELIRLLRLDETGTEKPELAVARYRQDGLLRGVQIGRMIRYRLPDALEFMERLKELNPV